MSLKGGMSNTEFVETLVDARKGKRKAINKLHEYAVGKGIMSEEKFSEMIVPNKPKDKSWFKNILARRKKD